jgi:hypothetical protein
MVGYSVIESAVVNRFIEHFSVELSETRCKAADVDAVINAMFEENSEFGCLFEYGGGSDEPRKPYKIDVWTWYIDGLFMIQLSEGIDQKKRNLIDKVTKVFSNDHTLGGVTPRVKMVNVGKAEIADVVDTPFVFIPFLIEAFDRDVPER